MNAALVAAGILLSRVLGVVRESLKAAYLGASGSIVADAFNAAFRIPNLLQNLFGEGALSASFIPVYANLLARGEKEEADRVAGAIAALLGLVTAVLVLGGVLGAPVLVDAIAGGFEGERRDLTIRLTRVLFPGAALFVWASWCLGVLNSHRRFFVSYAAPVAWNLAMIVALVTFRRLPTDQLAMALAWASVAGAALQFVVQLPVVLRVAPNVRFALANRNAHVQEIRKNFTPAFVGRGVAQINGYLDQLIASFLPVGGVSLLFYAQTVTLMPVSLFGISISAAELPEMASATREDMVAEQVRTRLQAGLAPMAYFVIPSSVAFLLLGDVIAAALFQYGQMSATDTQFLWGIFAAAGIGLLAGTTARLYSSAFYALRDTKTPVRFAVVRLAIAAGGGWFLALRAPAALGLAPLWGAAALTLSSSVAAWLEYVLLKSRLQARVGPTGLALSELAVLWGAAIVAGGAGYAVRLGTGAMHQVAAAALVFSAYGAVYFAVTAMSGVPTARTLLRRARDLA